MLESAFFEIWLDGAPDCEDSGAAVSLQSMARYAAHPAHLPKLSSVYICDSEFEQEDPESHCKSVVPELLQMICAPALACLHFEQEGGWLDMSLLLAALSRFRALCTLKIRSHAPSHRLGLRLPCTCTDASARKHSLPALRAVEVVCTHASLSMLTAATVARAAQHTLTQLTVSGMLAEAKTAVRKGTLPPIDTLRSAFMDLWRAVGGCSQLRDLEIGWLCGVPGTELAAVRSSAISDCLQKLPQVTRLVLEARDVQYMHVGGSARAEPCTLNGSDLAPGVRALAALRVLKVCNGFGTVVVENSQELVSACCACTALQDLWLCVKGISSESVKMVAVELRHMTQLVLAREACPDTKHVKDLCAARRDRAVSTASQSGCKLYLADGPIGATDLPDDCYDI